MSAAVAIEDAGFEIRDSLIWNYGSGFPKSLNVGNGRGTALKPAFEPVVVARKPLIGTVAANVLKHGTGALNIDACRVQGGGAVHAVQSDPGKRTGTVGADLGFTRQDVDTFRAAQAASIERTNTLGRWPANVIFTHAPGCGEDGCAPGCPVAALDAQSGDAGASRFFTVTEYGDDDLPGVPFFYNAKASRSEREAGCGELPARSGADAVERAAGEVRNHHPTVKPVAVMRWLVRLVTPPGGVVLDPFLGSGTTGIAAMKEGMSFVGIEREADYLAIARARIAHAVGGGFVDTEPTTTARTLPAGKGPATTYVQHSEATVFVKSVESNVKRGAKVVLGQRTLLVGPNGSGKSSIVNAVELALTGRASDLVGRAEVAKAGDLLALAPVGDDALWSKAILSDEREVAWRCERNAKTGGAREPVHSIPSDLTVEFPARDVRAALEGSAATVRAWLIGRIGATVTEEAVVGLLPEDLRAAYAEICRPLFGTPVHVLLDAREATAKTLRTLGAESKAAEKLADSLGSRLSVEPTEAEIETTRVRVRETAAEWSVSVAVPVAVSVDPEPLRVAALRAVSLYSDLVAEAGRLSEAVGASAPVNEDVARLRDALTRVLTFHAVQQLDACLVCGGAAGHAHASMRTRAEGMTHAARRDVETLDLRVKLTRAETLAETAKAEAQRAVTAYQTAAAAASAAPASPASGSTAERAMALREAETTLRELEQARGAWANVRAAKAQARDASARQRLYSDLRDEIEGAIKALLERSRAAFVARVQSFLPESDRFDLVLDADGKEVCRFGFVRGEHLHTALSGAEWARLTLALAAATTADQSLAVLTPEDRAFDADTLTAVMRGLSSAPGQVILCSPVAPAGRTPKGWTVIDLAGEKPAKAPKAPKAAMASTASTASDSDDGVDLSPDAFFGTTPGEAK